MIGEKVVCMGLAFMATIILARYLGPEDFGSLAYALSLVAIFSSAGHLGLSGLVVREIVRDTKGHASTLGTVAILKVFGMTFGYLMLLVYAFVYEGAGSIEFYLIAIAGVAILFAPTDVIEFWFQAFLQARYTAIARISSHLFTAIYKMSLVLLGSSVVYFATAQVLQAALGGLLLAVLFNIKSELSINRWRFSLRRARKLMKDGWLVYIGSFFAVIYLKVDQVMLRWLSGSQEVGQYAIAAQLSEVWYFLPTVIVASFFPSLIELRERNDRLFKIRMQQLLDLLFLVGFSLVVVVTIAAPWAISILFGPNYASSASILVIHIWAGIFIFMRAAFSKWILIEGALMFSLITQGLGALVNVLMNLALIPLHGGVGAAYATLVSYATASFFALFFHQRTRPVFWQMARALLSPIRYPILLARRV